MTKERMKHLYASHVTLPIVRYKIDQDFVKPKVAEERESVCESCSCIVAYIPYTRQNKRESVRVCV